MEKKTKIYIFAILSLAFLIAFLGNLYYHIPRDLLINQLNYSFTRP